MIVSYILLCLTYKPKFVKYLININLILLDVDLISNLGGFYGAIAGKL